MAGVINRRVAAEGLIAYQERENLEQFVYFPSSVISVLGETVKSFSCQYYGIGKEAQWVQAGPGTYLDLAGGVVQGEAKFDGTKEQLDALKQAITKAYKVDEPVLVPAILKEVSAVPIFAQSVAKLGGNSEYSFPKGVSVGESFNFNIDSGNSLFPELIAGLKNSKSNNLDSPSIGINFSGKLDLYGEPFKARIKADLKQVWEYVRTQVGVKANLGWFNFGSDYDSIAQDMVKNNVIDIEFVEGRATAEFGQQLLESTKKVFEAINQQITSGEGMFKFEPNPEPQEPKDSEDSWGASLSPWTVSVNLSFADNSFSQSIYYDETVSFQGIFTIDVHSSMNLGMICSAATKYMFEDITTGEDGCITPKKKSDLQVRIKKEVAAKETKIAEYEQQLIKGKIDLKTFEALLALLNTRMLTESKDGDKRTANDKIREIEKMVNHWHGTNVKTVPTKRRKSKKMTN